MHEIKRSRTQSNPPQVATEAASNVTVTSVTDANDAVKVPEADMSTPATSTVSAPSAVPTTVMTTATTPVQQQQQQQQQSWLYVNLPHPIIVQPQTVTVATVTPNPSASQGPITTTSTIAPPPSLVNAQVAHIIPSPVLTTSQQQQLQASQPSSQFHQQWYALPLPISSCGVLPNTAVITQYPDWMYTNTSLQSLPSSSRENSDLHLDVHLRETVDAQQPGTYKDKHLPSSSASLSSTSSHVIPSDDEAGISF